MGCPSTSAIMDATPVTSVKTLRISSNFSFLIRSNRWIDFFMQPPSTIVIKKPEIFYETETLKCFLGLIHIFRFSIRGRICFDKYIKELQFCRAGALSYRTEIIIRIISIHIEKTSREQVRFFIRYPYLTGAINTITGLK